MSTHQHRAPDQLSKLCHAAVLILSVVFRRCPAQSAPSAKSISITTVSIGIARHRSQHNERLEPAPKLACRAGP
eukprot:3496537-Rhodomonas_salina.1